MGKSIWSTKPGFALALNDPDAIPMVFDFDDWGGFDVRRSIVQGVSISRMGNFQFLHTLRGFVYVYIFGERMGEFVISGIAFAGKCPDDQTDGISKVMEYYEEKGIAFFGKPVGIQVGKAGFRAFLIGAKFDIINPKGRLGQFAFSFRTIPPEL